MGGRRGQMVPVSLGHGYRVVEVRGRIYLLQAHEGHGDKRWLTEAQSVTAHGIRAAAVARGLDPAPLADLPHHPGRLAISPFHPASAPTTWAAGGNR